MGWGGGRQELGKGKNGRTIFCCELIVVGVCRSGWVNACVTVIVFQPTDKRMLFYFPNFILGRRKRIKGQPKTFKDSRIKKMAI